MITKIYFPVANTALLTSNTNINMTTDEYERAFVDNVVKNKNMMDDFTTHGFNIKNNRYYGVNYNNEVRDANDYIEYYEAEAMVNLHTGGDIDSYYLDTLVESERMLILSLNVNPNGLDYDIESEFNMWIGESDRINNDTNLSNQTKLSSLEGKNIKIEVEDSLYFLENCKIIQNNSDRNNPLNVIVIIEKITKL